MAEQLIAAHRVVPAAGDGPDVLSPGYVLVRDGHVATVGQGTPPRPPDVQLRSGVLTPGFVDLQVNGYFGVELQAADATGWRTVARRLTATGATAFVPTFITAPVPALAAALRAAGRLLRGDGRVADESAPTGSSLDSGADAAPVGARVLGVHVEGPFISPRRPGAHNTEWITPPSTQTVTELLDAGSGLLRIVTLAPELPGGLDAVRRLAAAGVLVSIGHSDATASQASAAVDAGARMVTHVFNAQRGLHHREPGLPGHALTDRRLTVGLIADLYHVAGPVCAIAFAAAAGRVFLVTDAASCAGMPPGRYLLGGQPIELPPGAGVPPVRADGTLAGSALRMDVAVANTVGTGVTLPAAVAAATRIPADLIGRPELGRIAPGALADLVWLDDELRTSATWVGGELAYRKASGQGVM